MEKIDVTKTYDRYNNNGWNSWPFHGFYYKLCEWFRVSLRIR